MRYLGPRFLSLQLPGSSLLILDLIHACNTVLNNTDKLESSPRTEAVSILANLLSHPEDLSNISVLQPEQDLQVIMCPDIKVSKRFVDVIIAEIECRLPIDVAMKRHIQVLILILQKSAIYCAFYLGPDRVSPTIV